MVDQDPLENEVRAEVVLKQDASGVAAAAKIKSRAIAAIDRLVGNAFDYINLPMESANAKRRALMDGQKKIISAAAEAAAKQIQSDPDFARVVLQNTFDGLERRFDNKLAVTELADEELKNLPPPISEEENSADEIDADWLNLFESKSELASTENMRRLFGHILAGEIRKPGTFSLSTLRIASELSQATAKLFMEVASVRFLERLPLSEERKKKYFTQLIELEADGLLTFSSGMTVRRLSFGEVRVHHLAGEQYVLIVEADEGVTELQYSISILSAAGRELATLFENDELAAIKIVFEAIKPSCKSLSIHRLINQQQYEVQPVEIYVKGG